MGTGSNTWILDILILCLMCVAGGIGACLSSVKCVGYLTYWFPSQCSCRKDCRMIYVCCRWRWCVLRQCWVCGVLPMVPKPGQLKILPSKERPSWAQRNCLIMGYLDTFTNSWYHPKKKKPILVQNRDLFGNSETEEKIFTPAILPHDCKLYNQLYHNGDCTERDNGQITQI